MHRSHPLAAPATAPHPAPPAALLLAPPTLPSHAARLTLDLTAAPAPFRIAAASFPGMLYNGAYIPPVWHVSPGDTLVVTLHNRLPEPTNLHFHGLHVSPRGNGDNVFVHVAPGASFRYELAIPPDHDPGLYWFHSHAHGAVSRQILGGLSRAPTGRSW